MANRVICASCSAPLTESARFCARCGVSVDVAGDLDAVVRAVPLAFAATRAIPADTSLSSASAIPPMRLPIGTRVGVYRVEGVLGEGGMGVVYRAYDEALGRPVALKCLHSNLAGDRDIRRRFAREARVLASVVHPNVVAVHDFVEHEHLSAIVMELIDGPSLVQYQARWRGRVPFAEIGVVFGGVLDAVGFGHDRGIVHRDLKPDNVLIVDTEDGPMPKVVDFGIAKILEGTMYTMTGALLGTCRYMSPEQVQRPERADARSDIYSLGVTLYQLVTGQVPFDSPNHFAVMMAHVHQAPRPPTELRADVPSALSALILETLEKDPEKRPASCAELRRRLDAALAPFASGPPAARVELPARLRDKDGTEMVLVPAGAFAMGPDRRSVRLDAFYIDKTPVTNAAFASFLAVTGYRPEGVDAARFLQHLRGSVVALPTALEQHPVVYVSWDDARAYAAWAGKRLPSEAEWEKASRGTDGRKYPWGRSEPGSSRANYGKEKGGTTPVGAYPDGASPYGVLDAAGNVWEWCDDYDDPAFYANGPRHNPRNTRPTDGRGAGKSLVVMRGGSWLYGPRSLRTFARTGFEPHYRFASGGFRCARSA